MKSPHTSSSLNFGQYMHMQANMIHNSRVGRTLVACCTLRRPGQVTDDQLGEVYVKLHLCGIFRLMYRRRVA
jgi:hypothetical protein